MIAHHAVGVVLVDVAGVLVHQVLYLIMVVEHEHQRDDGHFAAGTGGQVAYAASRVGLDGGNELPHVAALHGLSRRGIHLAGIVIRRIM